MRPPLSVRGFRRWVWEGVPLTWTFPFWSPQWRPFDWEVDER